MDWEQLEACVAECARCRLCERRKHTVLGEGNRKGRIMLVGEGPGAQEDEQGRPFVGAAGQLLDKMLAAISLSRDAVYQTKLIRPRMIVCLGTVAAQTVIGPEARISRVRGQFVERKGFILTGTYHPAALLRDDRLKVDAWHDLQAIARRAAAWEETDEG